MSPLKKIPLVPVIVTSLISAVEVPIALTVTVPVPASNTTSWAALFCMPFIVMLSLNSMFPPALPARLVLTSRSAALPRTKAVVVPPSWKIILSPVLAKSGSVPPREYASAL